MKLRCRWYQREMAKYADAGDGLPPASPLARHLEACDGCRAAWAGLRRLSAELRQALIVPATPVGFEERAWSRLPMVRRRHRTPFVPALACAAALAAAAVVGLILMRYGPAGHPSRLADSSHAPPLLPPAVKRGPLPMLGPGPQTGPHPLSPSPNTGGGGTKELPMPDSPHPDTGGQETGAGPRISPPSPEVGGGGRGVGAGLRARPRLSPTPKRSAPPAARIPDLQYLDGSDPALVTRWSPIDRREEARLEAGYPAKPGGRQLPPPADDFVRIPFPLIASTGSAGITAATRAYEKQAKVVDTRLFRKVTLAEKGVSLADFCAHLQEQTGVELRASRAAADEKVTVFVKEVRARDVMRAVARLFGFLWSRSGEDGAYRYELDQDLRSQLIEEEMRNRDQDAAFLTLDAEMQKYRPYLDTSFEELKKRWDGLSEAEKRDIWVKPDNSGKRQLWHLVAGDCWGGAQLYFHLTARDRAALLAGQELIFRPDAPDPDHRLPAELVRPILQSFGQYSNGRTTGLAEAPGIQVTQVRLRMGGSELGNLSLLATMSAQWGETTSESRGSARPGTSLGIEMATGRHPSAASPDNATTNAALRGQSPFDQVVTLHPKPSCPAVKGFRMADMNPIMDVASFELNLSQPYTLSADVWEAVHQATGLPVVADFYTHLYPAGKVTVERRPLFDALCTVGDALGVRWRKEGDFLLCRSTSYFWDKLKEVPNRYLQRWARDRDANGGLPLADFLEMASMTDQQLDSGPVAQGIEHYWGLPEWAWLSRRLLRPFRHEARVLALLSPEQLRRALGPDGLPIWELSPAQQQCAVQLEMQGQEAQEREGGLSPPIQPEQFADAVIRAIYVPGGWYVAYEPEPTVAPMSFAGGRTPEEAKAAARQYYPRSSPQEVRRAKDGYFSFDFYFVVGRK